MVQLATLPGANAEAHEVRVKDTHSCLRQMETPPGRVAFQLTEAARCLEALARIRETARGTAAADLVQPRRSSRWSCLSAKTTIGVDADEIDIHGLESSGVTDYRARQPDWRRVATVPDCANARE